MDKFADFILTKRKIVFSILLVAAIVCGYLMTLVTVNSNMMQYLPEDSRVRAAMPIMATEFGAVNAPTLYVMIENLQIPQGATSAFFDEQFTAFIGVAEVGQQRHQGAHTLFTLTLETGLSRPAQRNLVTAINDTFSDYNIEMSGSVAGVEIELHMHLIIIPTLIILTIILLLMCSSWVEPLLLFVNIGIAILLNMGTNIIFDSISDITQMIAGLLQVALSMDYSIIFLNRYRQEKAAMAVPDHYLAMKNTIRNSFSTISGISFTTIVGMMMLVFMSFTIGADIGLVIAKGVFASLICVFGVMPALILWFDKLIDKTTKPVLNIKMGVVGRFAYKARYIVFGLFAVLFIGSAFLQRGLEITYSEVEYDPVHQIFDLENSFVILYRNEDEANFNAVLENFPSERALNFETRITEYQPITTVFAQIMDIHSYQTLFGQGFTELELATMLAMDPMMVGLAFRNYFIDTPAPILLGTFMQFTEFHLFHNPLFTDAIDISTVTAPVNHYTPQHAPNLVALEFTNYQIAELMNLDLTVVNQLLYLYDLEYGAPLAYTKTLTEFLDFLITDFTQIPMFAPLFTGEGLIGLTEVRDELTAASRMFVGENYSRAIINTTFEFEGATVFAFLDELIAQLDAELIGPFYLLGTSVMPHEMAQTFPGEYSFITILTVIAFFIVGAISFKSISVSALLAITIQAAVFITMGVTYFQDGGIMFLPLIIAQVLLKSRVIDYGILYTANYIEARRVDGVKDAIATALNNSIDTIMTSGLIIVVVCFVVGLVFQNVNVAISEILLLIAQGCFIGVMLSIFVLPSLIAAFDRFVTKTKSLN